MENPGIKLLENIVRQYENINQRSEAGMSLSMEVNHMFVPGKSVYPLGSINEEHIVALKQIIRAGAQPGVHAANN